MQDGWTAVQQITIDKTKVGGSIYGYPVYINLADIGGDFWETVQSTGADIRLFSGDNVTELPYELVSIDTTLETGELYFKGDLSSTSDTNFYIVYGNPNATAYAATDTYGRNNVWTTEGYSGVYHLSKNLIDSSGSGIDGTHFYTTQQDGYVNFPGEVTWVDSLTGSDVQSFGTTTGVQRIAQSFVLSDTPLAQLDVMIMKATNTGAPVNAVTCSIQEDSSGSPSGVDLLSSSLNWNGTGAPTAGVDFLMYQLVATTLTSGTTYWLVFRVASSASDANHPNATYDSTGTYGVFKSFDGATWSTVPGSLRFRLHKSGYVKLSSSLTGIPVQNIAMSFALLKTDNVYESILSSTLGSSTGHIEINGNATLTSTPNAVGYRSSGGTNRNIATGVSTGDGNYHWYTYIWDTTNCRVYVDGVQRGTTSTDAAGSNSFLYFGSIQARVNSTYGKALNGKMKSVRIGTASAISSAVILTQYNNLSAPSSFYSIDYIDVGEYTRVGFEGKQFYDESDISYDEPSVFYDSTDVEAYVNITKPTTGGSISSGMATGLLMPPTYSQTRYIDSSYTKIAKPTT